MSVHDKGSPELHLSQDDICQLSSCTPLTRKPQPPHPKVLKKPQLSPESPKPPEWSKRKTQRLAPSPHPKYPSPYNNPNQTREDTRYEKVKPQKKIIHQDPRNQVTARVQCDGTTVRQPQAKCPGALTERSPLRGLVPTWALRGLYTRGRFKGHAGFLGGRSGFQALGFRWCKVGPKIRKPAPQELQLVADLPLGGPFGILDQALGEMCPEVAQHATWAKDFGDFGVIWLQRIPSTLPGLCNMQ